MEKTKVAVIGDSFMLPETFVSELHNVLDPQSLDIRTLQLNWPDEPMTLSSESHGVREFFGDPDELADFIGDASVLINHLGPVTASMLERLPGLQLVAVSRGGPVNLDMEALKSRGIKVVNTPGRNANAVAEFTVGMIIVETRRIRAGHESLRDGIWRGDLYRADRTGDELADLCVGMLGFGRVGRLLAQKLRPFDCRILISDPFVTVDEDGLEQVDQERVLRDSDVVTINARVTPDTVGLIGKKELGLMKPTALLVNVARGPLVDYDALYEALQDGQIAAAALDTFPEEPTPKDWPLLQLPNVIVTPHIAGASRRTTRVAAASAAEEFRRHLNGEQPLSPCL